MLYSQFRNFNVGTLRTESMQSGCRWHSSLMEFMPMMMQSLFLPSPMNALAMARTTSATCTARG